LLIVTAGVAWAWAIVAGSAGIPNDANIMIATEDNFRIAGIYA